MEKKILSICIPVYNRKEVFKYSLYKACKAVEKHEDKVEIIISDNHSEDDLYDIYLEMKKMFTNVNMVFHRNDSNIGPARNFLKAVDLSSGEYCWIIGSDDFIKNDSIAEILNILEENKEFEFLCCNFDLLDLNAMTKKISNLNEVNKYTEDKNNLTKNAAPSESYSLKHFDSLIDPKYNNVFLGAVMTGIFRKVKWDMVEKSNITNSFKDLASIYPHCYIYAQTFMGGKAYYFGKPLITVGEGAREWSTDTGQNFWESSLPLIHLSIIPAMLEFYKMQGLDITQYKKSKRWVSSIVASSFPQLIVRKYFNKKPVKDGELIKPFNLFIKYGFNFNLYLSLSKKYIQRKK